MASRGVNKVILVGRLGNDPEVRQAPNGASIANITIATSEEWKDKNTGEKKEKTEWHRVVIFGKLAEIAGQYLKKGSQVYFEGKLQTRKWTDNAGIDRYSTEVVIDINGIMQMLGSSQNSSEAPTPALSGTPKPQPTGYNKQAAVNNPQVNFDDDVPF